MTAWRSSALGPRTIAERNDGRVAEFDHVAALYDQTRGGGERGDDDASDLDGILPAGAGPILELGVGTGVVALGLRRPGRQVMGIDVSRPMLARACQRLGPVLVQTDAEELAISASSVNQVVSAWVVHAIADPARPFAKSHESWPLRV